MTSSGEYGVCCVSCSSIIPSSSSPLVDGNSNKRKFTTWRGRKEITWRVDNFSLLNARFSAGAISATEAACGKASTCMMAAPTPPSAGVNWAILSHSPPISTITADSVVFDLALIIFPKNISAAPRPKIYRARRSIFLPKQLFPRQTIKDELNRPANLFPRQGPACHHPAKTC